ncbi:heavy metal translocating P-type ATPase [Undibacterium sp. Ren11W]|uniref:heavy metal translocating P-type ATPase n=1 Tax=Undibacterium sp. Ren11W TaxID=3413045 RepID=UPI003BF07359
MTFENADSQQLDRLNSQQSHTEKNEQHEKLSIAGMRCAACVQLIAFRVKQLPGVLSFEINSASHTANLRWQNQQTSLPKIITAIVDLGYAAFPAHQSLDEYERQEKKMALWRLFIAGFAMMQVMMYAFPAYLVPVPQVDGDLTPDLDRLLKLASLVITIPVICFSSLPFFRSAIRDIKNRHIGMDVPVSIGILLTFFASIWATFNGGAVYYDSAIMFVCLLLAARFIEAQVQAKTTAALRVLTRLSPMLANRLLAHPESRLSESVEVQHLQLGDFLLVSAGEQIPADGRVVVGESECDEALMTGESHPVPKQIGSEVIAGSINLNGVLVMQAEQVGSQTQLSSLVGMMERAATEKPPLVLLADKHASTFLIVIMSIAVMAGLAWWQIEAGRALWIAVSIIVVTCPCALSLATPGVMSAAIGEMAKQGVLVAKGAAIERLAGVTHFVLDKTGTLTFGRLRVVEGIICHRVGADFSAERAEALSLAMAAGSMHPVSKAIADALTAKVAGNATLAGLDKLKEIAGAGIEASYNGKTVRLGRLDFVQQLHGESCSIPAHLSGKTLSALGDENGWIALFALEDVLREDAIFAVQQLHKRGMHITLLSGDRIDVVKNIALECGITDYHGDLSPGDKYDAVKRLQLSGAVVAMVGDGMNDGPVLALADVSIAMGQGAPIAQTRSDLLLMSNRLAALPGVLSSARMALKLIRQNLGWAIVYNVVAIPAAVLGLLEPWHAALGMSISSLLVVLNGLRLLVANPDLIPNSEIN